MIFTFLSIFCGIVCLGSIGLIIWHIVRGPDARRRKALAVLLIKREMVGGADTRGTAQDRRASKHTDWNQSWKEHQRTHSQTHHAATHQGSWSNHHHSHASHASGYHSGSHHGGSHYGGCGHNGHMS
ncbi:MAG TPA: hypothetical protein VHD63_04005 [Ktedonobacteraceae bacterium]|nr:hypothetical protein [Ktedonobacteraceae bacterium]